jgi:hypothetical protein
VLLLLLRRGRKGGTMRCFAEGATQGGGVLRRTWRGRASEDKESREGATATQRRRVQRRRVLRRVLRRGGDP